MDLTTVEIRTRRLLLRPLAKDDQDAVFREFTSEITRYMQPMPPSQPDDSGAFIADSRRNMRNGEELVCAVLDLETGRFQGCAGIHQLTSPAPELGIWIARDAQGTGRGREAVEALLAWGAAYRPRAPFFRYPVDRANAASRRIAEQLGGSVESECPGETADGRLLDIVEYHIPAARD